MHTVGNYYVIETTENNDMTAQKMFGEKKPVVRLMKSEIEVQRDGTETVVYTVQDSSGQLHVVHSQSDFGLSMTKYNKEKEDSLVIGSLVTIEEPSSLNANYETIGEELEVVDIISNGHCQSKIFKFKITKNGFVFYVHNNRKFMDNFIFIK